MSYENSEGPDQTVNSGSQIREFSVRRGVLQHPASVKRQSSDQSVRIRRLIWSVGVIVRACNKGLFSMLRHKGLPYFSLVRPLERSL